MRLVALVAVTLVAASAAAASAAAFGNGPLVARSLERHFNSADYKARLAKSGARLTSRILCAHERPLVRCSGRMRTSGVGVTANWKLAKISATRARLSWVFTAAGVPSRGSMLVAPRELGLRRF